MGKLTDFIKSKATDAATFALEAFAKEEFLESGMRKDARADAAFATAEAAAQTAARTAYNAAQTQRGTKLIKAALVPRSGESSNLSVIQFMFNPTDLSFSRSQQPEFLKGARTNSGLPKVNFGYVEPYSLQVAGILFDTYEDEKNVLTEYVNKIRSAMEFQNFTTTSEFYSTSSSGEIDILSSYFLRGTAYSLAASSETIRTIASAAGFTSLELVDPTARYDDYEQLPITAKRPPVYYFIWGDQNYMLCMISKLSYKLTMFMPNGMPVRAVVDLELTEVDLNVASRRFSAPQALPGVK